MRRQILTIMALAGVVMLAGCKKQGIETVPSGEGAVVFTATTGGGGEKTLLYPSENGAVKWETGDAIKVNNGDYELTDGAGETSGTFTYSTDAAPSAPYCAVYPNANGNSVSGSTVTLTLPDTQTLTENSFGNGANPMVAYSASETTLSFKNVCGALRIKLYGDFAVINKVTLESASSKKLCGTYTVNANSDTPTLTYSTGGGSTLTLTGDAVLLSDDKDSPTEFYAVLPVGSYSASDITVKAYFGDTEVASVGISMAFTIERSAVTVVQTAGAEVSTASCLVPGIFTVASGKQVCFSKGNLYTESDTRHLQGNQYGYVNSTATSGTTFDKYAQTVATGYDGTSESTIDSYTAKWYVLSRNEWKYLLNVNSNSASDVGKRSGVVGTVNSTAAYFMKCKMNSINGLVIFPDGFAWNETTMGTVPATSNLNAWTGNYTDTRTLEQWTAMEAAGCVFLPAAGHSVGSMGTDGSYWSSTSGNYRLDFYTNIMSVNTGTSSYCVRLVAVVE